MSPVRYTVPSPNGFGKKRCRWGKRERMKEGYLLGDTALVRSSVKISLSYSDAANPKLTFLSPLHLSTRSIRIDDVERSLRNQFEVSITITSWH